VLNTALGPGAHFNKNHWQHQHKLDTSNAWRQRPLYDGFSVSNKVTRSPSHDPDRSESKQTISYLTSSSRKVIALCAMYYLTSCIP